MAEVKIRDLFKSYGPTEVIHGLDVDIEDGEFIPKSYKTRFTLDVISGNLQISNVFGTTGMTYFSFSDILGDHQIAIGTEMVLTLENSDYFFYYGYLKNKKDYPLEFLIVAWKTSTNP